MLICSTEPRERGGHLAEGLPEGLPEGQLIRLVWSGVENLPILMVNQVIGQVVTPSRQFNDSPRHTPARMGGVK